MDNNADAWLGWTWFATGPLLADDYEYTLEPDTLGVDQPQMAVLESHIDTPCSFVHPLPFESNPSPDLVQIPIIEATSPVPQDSPENLPATFDGKL